ncbi:hypothetical protein [Malacoplasma muris]|uniref:hypothetical protein n=1 Tax=Malacoplasma muris TaxID=2119 RepID=UPI00398F719D
MDNVNLKKTKLPLPGKKINSYNVNIKNNNSLYSISKVQKKRIKKVSKKLPSPKLKKPIPLSNTLEVVNKNDTSIENLDLSKNLFTLKELIDLNIDVDYTKKVFMNGTTKYSITNEFVLEQLQNGDWFKSEEEKQHDYFYNNAIEKNNVDEINDEFYQQDDQINFNNQQDDLFYDNQNISNQEIVYDQLNDNQQVVSDYNENIQDQHINYDSLEQHLEKPIDVEYGSVQNDYKYENDYYDDVDESLNYVEHGNYDGYQQLPDANEIVSNWNKKLWRTEDILYKVYNISYNQNHEDPNQGCLYNLSFDVFPGDRIAIMAHDSVSDVLLMDILSNRVNKDSGYVFFNLKREQKWFDIYSNDYDGFDIELYNRRNDAIYQFQSPDYLAYATSKNDTISSTFKKIFNSVNYVVNEQVYEDLLYLLDIEKDLKTPIHVLSELQKRKFIFMCDVLIGKKIILMINLTEGFDMTQKLSFYRYINALYQDSDTVLIFNVKDSIEIKLLASRLMIIDDGEVVVNKKIKDILNSFETLDTFIVDVFDRLHKKYIQQ